MLANYFFFFFARFFVAFFFVAFFFAAFFFFFAMCVSPPFCGQYADDVCSCQYKFFVFLLA